MNTKNPILTFRTNSHNNPSGIDFKKHHLEKGFHEENVKAIMTEENLTSTLITRTREAADMSENS